VFDLKNITAMVTGTPRGVGMAPEPPRWLRLGGRVDIEIQKIGTLTNPVENEPI
jgi:2-keto-4-pentenoate hydratase/2-oxohepta-3-ene-1,7-dioic acid hydratase in catechol pathway